MVKDPVGGMQIEKKGMHLVFKRKTYYFCSDACKSRFDKKPAKFALK
ncbi:MAG: YHS domain-containing protein [Candidatus Aenigmarchaeota archaeon]|nr:YHS domain-containing protein [Candidatus Aenigmarchaeota archaeon]